MQKRWVYWLILGLGSISLIRSTVGQGTDFLVFWKAGRSLLDGMPIYQTAQDGGMVFKYPPWIAPFFIPFALFSFETAKWIWGIFCALCMAGIFSILERRLKVETKIWAPLAIFYWGLWVVHALDGQIIIPLMFLGMWGMTSIRANPLRDAVLPVAYSAKIFTIYPVLFDSKRFLKAKVVGAGIVVAIVLSGITAVTGFHGDASRMFHDWRDAASSGAKFLDPGQTRGSKNQSLTSFTARTFSVPADNTQAEVAISLSLYALAFFYFNKRLKGQSEVKKFMVGLALTPVFHPLPWHHLHLWTFPLAAFTLQAWLDQDKETRSRMRTYALFASLFLITLSSERVFRWSEVLRPFGHFLEWNVGRAWGALLLAWVATENE